MVKAALSFANWEGGFVVFGVAPNGVWRGLSEAELALVDPASLSELINGCIFPEIPQLNYIDFHHEQKAFALLHVPPSLAAPHVTTKEVVEKDPNGALRKIIARHALYCRQGAKSDLATPQQHHRILNRQSERVREELLRRVKEVPVPVPVFSGQGERSSSGASLTVARLTSDPNAPAVRLTRKREGTSGVLLHEELSDGLFNEINNVVDANALLCGGQDHFLLGEPIYYRIYAERQHVEPSAARLGLLARTALTDFYAPNLYWLLQLSPAESAAVIQRATEELKNPQVHGLMRVATLLGQPASDWLWRIFQNAWGGHTQRPDYYWTFKAMRETRARDPRLVALRTAGKTSIELPSAAPISVESLIDSPIEAAGLLSRCCLAVFEGQKQFRTAARHLDILAHGLELTNAAPTIVAALLA